MIKYILKKIIEFDKTNYLKRKILNKKKKAISIGTVHNILCIQMNAIGDSIMTQPVFAALKAKIPDARIDLICRPHIAPIFKNDPSIDAIYPFNTDKYRNWLFKRKSELETVLQNGIFDLLIDFTALPLTAAVCAIDKVPPSIGFKRSIRTTNGKIDLGSAYDINFDFSESMPIRELMAKLITPWYSSKNYNHVPIIKFDSNVIEKANRVLKTLNLTKKKYIVLHPGAKWFPKKWPAFQWKNLIEISQKEKLLPYLIIGNHEDKKFIGIMVGDNHNSKIPTLVDENLDVSAALIKMSKLCICNDSAAMHISAAVGTPSIAIFGPVSPKRSAPGSDEGCTVLYNKEYCSPCTLHYTKERCRRGISFCMRSINASMVLNNIKTICQE